jgi:hypothetical protein
MNRRQLLHSLGLLSAHAMFPVVLSIQVIDIIIPATQTLSASQVDTHLFLDRVFANCMTDDQQKIMREGLAHLSSGFASAPDKLKYLTDVDQRAYANNEAAAYFKAIKQYTLVGFFTSQEGTTKASNYVKVPEAYRGEVPANESTLNYGKTNLQFYL